ncbi:MAG: B12-binding domain-containing radical SAM protein [Candidatus Binatia bacterium]
MKIVFLNPPAADVEWFGDKANFESPLGLAMLAAYVRQQGHEPVIIDVAAERLSPEATAARVAALGPAVVGITANTVMMPPAICIATVLQERLPDTLVVLGGKHVSVVPEDVYNGKPPVFDVSVIGEGEETLLEIMQALEQHGSKQALLAHPCALDSIRGVAFQRAGKLVKTPPRPFIRDLDSLPFPARDLLPFQRYKPVGNRYKRLPAFSMVAIRGCPYPCTFCSEARTTVRFSSPARVVAEIEHLIEQYGAKEITFWDDTMTVNKKWMYELCDRIIEKQLDIVWSCFAAINTITPELLAKMKRAGCWNIFYGIETTDETLKQHIRIQKFGSDLQVREIIQQTQAAGIEVRAAFMVGLPGETPEMAMKTLSLAILLEPDYAQWNYTVPYPGTELWGEMHQHGRLIARHWGEFSNWYPSYLPFAYQHADDLIRVRKQILRRFYLRPRYVWGRLTKIRHVWDVRRYAGLAVDFLSVLGKAGGRRTRRADPSLAGPSL